MNTVHEYTKYIFVRRGSYRFRRRVNGTLLRKVVGRVGEITLDEACRRAAEYAQSQAAPIVGSTPDTDAPLTLGALWQRYLTVHARPHKRSWRQDEGLWDYHLAERYADADAKTFDLAAVHAEIGVSRGKVVANHVANIVRRMYTVAGLTPPKVKKFRERSRERFLTHDEVARLLSAAEQSTIRDFIHVCLYTGARSGNVRTMTWSEVDLDGHTWTVPATKSKNGRTLRIHLCDKALAVLRARRLCRSEGTDYVFPQRGGWDAPMIQPRKMWLKVCAKAGLQDVTIHDLRRTLGSHLAMSGASMAVIAKVLGHADLKSTAIYARLSPSAASAAVDAVVAGF